MGTQIRIAEKIQGKLLKENMKLERKIQIEEKNQKLLAKEGRPKRYHNRNKHYKQNRTFQNIERKFNQQVGRE